MRKGGSGVSRPPTRRNAPAGTGGIIAAGECAITAVVRMRSSYWSPSPVHASTTRCGG